MKNKKIYMLIAFVLTILILGRFFWPIIEQLGDGSSQNLFIESLRNQGIIGILYFILLQIIQVVTFLIPSAVIAVAGGILYGTWWGYIICTIGVIIASAIMYYVARYLGYDYVNKILSNKKLDKFKYIRDERNIELIVFILYFIPGSPKDALTYFIPFTNISFSKFLFISILGRFPATISSALLGSHIMEGNIFIAAGIYIGIALLGLLGIYINKKYVANKKNK